jgi:glyoxylase-like metal-dependent hydrolase (beta-lactamase superfamily II)
MSAAPSWPRVVDLRFLGRPNRISSGVIRTPAGVLVVDPGPTTCVPALIAGLAEHGVAPGDLCGLLLTHIHLDHAGAAGTLVRRHPHIKVYVHERGAPHLLNPARLLASATRLYGDQMDRLWGEFAMVPESNLRVPTDGEVLEFGGVQFDVAYTPGHASHHVCYRDRQSGVVYAGDTGGIRVGPSPYVLPPTPPPDIDVAAWQQSIRRLRAWDPTGVFVTHFGLYVDAQVHLDILSGELEVWESLAGSILAATDEASRKQTFIDAIRGRIRDRVSPAEVDEYRESMSLDDCWAGLERYWRKRREGSATDGR